MDADFGPDIGDFTQFGHFDFKFKTADDLFKDFFDQGLFKDDDLSWLSGHFDSFGSQGQKMGGQTGTNPTGKRATFSHTTGAGGLFDRFGDDDFFTRGFGKNLGTRFSSGFDTQINTNFGSSFGSSPGTASSMQTGKSVSTVTKTVNGKTVTTTTTIIKEADGTVTKEVKEETDDGRGNRNVRYLTNEGEGKVSAQKFLKSG